MKYLTWWKKRVTGRRKQGICFQTQLSWPWHWVGGEQADLTQDGLIVNSTSLMGVCENGGNWV